MSYFRHPKTTQERRANQEGMCRAKRRPANVPSSWEDLAKTSQRSWKCYRKSRYRRIRQQS